MSERGLAFLPLVAKVVAAHAANNVVAPAELPALIDKVYVALSGLGATSETVVSNERRPAAPVKKSVFKDYIVCLEDGRKMKTMRRHLRTAFDLTPEAYRERWGLPPDYPMVAPGHAAHRSQLAKEAGLGRFGRMSATATEKPKGPVVQKVPEGVSGKKLRRKIA